MRNQGGFIALTSVLIVGAIVLLVGIGVLLRSVDESNMSLSQDLSFQSHVRAEACAEHALMKMKENLDYIGNDSIMIDGELCEILPVENSGNNKIIKTQSSISGYVKKVEIEVNGDGSALDIISWNEVPDFN